MGRRLAIWALAGGAILSAAVGVAAVGDSPALTLEALADGLATRTAAIERREQAFAVRESELRAAEGRLAERLVELEKLRAEIEALTVKMDEERLLRLNTVVKAMESMKPAAAGAMVAQLDIELAIEVLSKMNRGKAGKVLGALPPDLAATIAEGMAARRAP